MHRRFAAHCLESGTTYKLLKPHIHDFWWKIILPVLSFNAVDHKRWVEDPEEFIRLLNDAKNTITDPRIAATEFIIDMMRVSVFEERVVFSFWPKRGYE